MATTSKRPKATSKKATAKKPTKAASKKKAASTRTSSRSAKRRSPKAPPEDAELLEYERTQFLRAMDKYKRQTGKTFPSWTEVLSVLRDIGWVSPSRLRDVMNQAK
ncbi:MAG: hypothetical protein DHS20C15_02220 [Planctomycetota bacterium]|nr:MAG: hypothetical protein DHS20C15_02220 [Planctomycetota bacterium]